MLIRGNARMDDGSTARGRADVRRRMLIGDGMDERESEVARRPLVATVAIGNSETAHAEGEELQSGWFPLEWTACRWLSEVITGP